MNPNYNSDYEIRLAELGVLGGDTTKCYDSVYEIDLEILARIQGGGIAEQVINDDVTSTSTTYSSTKIVQLLTDAGFKTAFVNELPASGDTHTIYFVPSTNPDTQNTKDEFMWTGSAWEQVGSTTVDLSNYYTKPDINNFLNQAANVIIDTNTRIDNLIDDSSNNANQTLSSSKILELVGNLSNIYENAQTIDFKFGEVYTPAEVGDKVVYMIAGNQVISEYKGEDFGWEQLEWNASALYFDTENSVLYAYNTEAGELIEVTIPNTFVVSNLNTDTKLKTVKTAGTYNVIQHLNSTAHGSYLKNWVMTVTSVDYDDEDYQTGDRWYQVLENNITIKKRNWSATRQTNDGWSTFGTYYKGEIKDTISTPSKYYTYSQFKTNGLLDLKQNKIDYYIPYDIEQQVFDFSSMDSVLQSGNYNVLLEVPMLDFPIDAATLEQYFQRFNVTTIEDLNKKILEFGAKVVEYNGENYIALLSGASCSISNTDSGTLQIFYIPVLNRMEVVRLYINNTWTEISNMNIAGIDDTTSSGTDIYNTYSKSKIDNLLSTKQNILTAGNNIDITTTTVDNEEVNTIKAKGYIFNETKGSFTQEVPQSFIDAETNPDSANINTGEFSTVFGRNHNVSGDDAFVAGDGNTVSGSNAFATGGGNTASAWGVNAIGYGNTASNTLATAMGYFNTISSYGGLAAGIQNNVSAPNNTASFAIGRNNTVSMENGIAIGSYNTVSGTGKSNAMAIGNKNTVSGKCAFVANKDNIATGEHSFVHGYCNIEDTVLQNPVTDAASKYLEIVGNGGYKGDIKEPSNAYTLDWIGNGWFKNDVTCGGADGDTPTHSLSGKQNTLTAGSNIDITNDTISTKGYIFDDTNKTFIIEGAGNNVISGTSKNNVILGGSKNQVTENSANHNVTMGRNNVNNGVAAFVGGSYNTSGIWANGSAVFGQNNTVNATASICSGVYNTINATVVTKGRMSAFGTKLTTNNSDETALGTYNISHSINDYEHSSSNTALSFGIGADTGNKNAFEMLWDGKIFIKGIGGYQGTDTTVQDATIKSLQDIITDLQARIAALEGNS